MNFDQQEKQASPQTPIDPTGAQRYRTPVGKALLTRWLYDCTRRLTTIKHKGNDK